MGPEGLAAYIRAQGGTLLTPKVRVTEADVAHVHPGMFPIRDAADFVTKISLVVHRVHLGMARDKQDDFERRAPRDEHGKPVTFGRMATKEKGADRHG